MSSLGRRGKKNKGSCPPIDPPVLDPPNHDKPPLSHKPRETTPSPISFVEACGEVKHWLRLPPFFRLLFDGVFGGFPFLYVAALYFAHDNNAFLTLAYKLPIKILCPAAVTVFALSSFGMLDLLRLNFVRRRSKKDETGLVGNIIAAAGIFYALVMGLIATATWDDFKLVSEAVQKEVGAASNMFEFAEGDSEEYRDQLRAKLIYYVSDVLVCDWEAQKGGIGLGKGHDDDLGPLMTQVISFDPKSAKENTLHPVLLGELGKVIDAREARSRAITGIALPEVLWVVVAGCSLIVLLMVCWGPAQEEDPPLLLVGGWGALVGFVVFMTIAMDHPLWGELSVSKEPYAVLEERWKNLSGKTGARYEIKEKLACVSGKTQ